MTLAQAAGSLDVTSHESQAAGRGPVHHCAGGAAKICAAAECSFSDSESSAAAGGQRQYRYRSAFAAQPALSQSRLCNIVTQIWICPD